MGKMNSENISGTNDAKKGKRALLAKYCITWLSGRLDSDWPFMEKHENLYKCRKKIIYTNLLFGIIQGYNRCNRLHIFLWV